MFNGQGLDGERLAQRLQARLAVQQALKSPNLGLGVDLGQVRGVPFLAYDYISGKTLAALAEQASKKRSPIPLDHALLITERIALGLAVAYETRVEDERVMHGFLTPHLVVVSNEGELRTVGFEASAGLREFAGHPLLKESVGRYLSPEALAGSPVAKTDDVYSMGALLYELLTGQKVPMNPPNGFGPVVDQAVLAFDGSALHPDLGNLLKRSLGARDQRIADVVTWHKTLAKMMFDGQYNPTTFNLAFFMHNLFREEIERETQELELESTTQIPLPKIAAAASAGAPAAPAAAGRPAAAPAAAPTFGMGGGAKDAPPKEDTAVLRDRYGLETPKASSKNVIFAAAAAGWSCSPFSATYSSVGAVPRRPRLRPLRTPRRPRRRARRRRRSRHRSRRWSKRSSRCPRSSTRISSNRCRNSSRTRGRRRRRPRRRRAPRRSGRRCLRRRRANRR